MIISEEEAPYIPDVISIETVTSGGRQVKVYKTARDEEYWLIDADTFHCADGPAYRNADTRFEWYVEGKMHRIDGPSIVYYRPIINVWTYEFRLDDIPLNFDTWLVQTPINDEHKTMLKLVYGSLQYSPLLGLLPLISQEKIQNPF